MRKDKVSESDANDDIVNEMMVKTKRPAREPMKYDADANDDLSNEFATSGRHSEYR